MKKDVAASAAGAVAPKKPEFSLIDEDLLKSRIYTIRGVKVMLDADLAEIYGYSTKRFNEQVRNNIAKFDKDFRFQLNDAEISLLSRSNLTTNTELGNDSPSRSKFSSLNNGGRGSNIKYMPYAFTEQGIYMLMTVLKGEQATAQSKALIRLFKQMKDYIAAENTPDVSAGMVALATQPSLNTRDIAGYRALFERLLQG
ncbi:MAG: ORF6N domain-containing protein [Fibrobacter sp.]|nr:ORF6N domain-containing protein [Fibrobacter sp.]MBR4007462.1 ORF6N domain-containing protein [Fibrobacter sp.]